MFQFRAFPSYAYFVQRTIPKYCSGGFPHSEISGSTDICSSPKLIAACHVLLRLLMPRHSPCALISLTIFLVLRKNYAGHRSFQFLARIVVLPIIPQKNLFASPYQRSTLCCLAYYLIIFPLFSFQGAGRRYTFMYPLN